MPLLARLSDRASRLLYQLVYSFPSKQATSVYNATTVDATNSLASPTITALDQDGEGKALTAALGSIGFAGSGYGMTLFIMAILLNRIHHIVRRPRQQQHFQDRQLEATGPLARIRNTVSRLLTHPETPQVIRIPGVFVLLRAWLLFSILLLQVMGLWPENDWSSGGLVWRKLVEQIGSSVREMNMETVCWQVFLSVCGGLVCSGIANGLDPVRRRDVGTGFNLFGFSFLLHLYSSPLTHKHINKAGFQGRPDVHALFQLWLSLTELAWLQANELSATMRNNVLFPTSVCGIVGITHFAYVLTQSPLRFPSFTFLTHVLALILSTIILSTMALKAVTHIFTIGYIPSLVSLLPHEGVVPNVEDDFGVALLKIGTACIEATSLSGLHNELSRVEEPKAPWVEMDLLGSELHRGTLSDVVTPGFSTEITNTQVNQEDKLRDENRYWKHIVSFARACFLTILTGIFSVIFYTRIGRKILWLSQKLWSMRWWYGPRSWRVWTRDAWREPPERQELRRLGLQLDLLKSMEGRLEKALGRSPHANISFGTSSALEISNISSSLTQRSTKNTKRETWTYRDYLLQDVQGDIEDDEGEWEEDIDGRSDTESLAATDSINGADSGDETEMEEDRKAAVYRDLIIAGSEGSSAMDLQPILLAHLTSRISAPLTRHQYASLITHSSNSGYASRQSPPMAAQSGVMGLRDVIKTQREVMSERNVDDDEETKRACVVCMVNMRNTILWPCRCLAVCNDCRETLAARLSAPEHMCPCCRRKVEGYSRIYIP
ncbi:uncharacterized protein L203_100555 [Cryptococcus depauperatus CBS 7841]|uniref:Uncharacterized protein n=1 Tax=Cryptococcus depauperatus CBS 7841 TaxID=1295531 RepID=A0A1E3IWU7_9TREE|nr:hypothetical protein L203_00338 [Cryptococcus depauperatus CBS 7841]